MIALLKSEGHSAPPPASREHVTVSLGPQAQQPAGFQSNGSSRRVMHELHIQPPGTINRPAAFKLLQKTHSTILASNTFISNA